MLDHGALADDPALVPLSHRLRGVMRGSDAEVERGGTGAWIDTIAMFLVIQDLVLVLSGTVINTAVASLGDLPLEAQFEIIRDLGGRVGQASPLPFTRQRPVLDQPVSLVLPAPGGLAVEQQLEILLVLGVTQGVDVFGTCSLPGAACQEQH